MIPPSDPKNKGDVVSTLSGSEDSPRAIQIVKLGRSASSAAADSLVCKPYDVAEVHDRLEQKMRMIRLEQDKAREAAGWTRFEGQWIPPGWVQRD